jgi:hypothetical protein
MAIKTFSDGVSLPASDINSYLTNSGLVYVKQTQFSGSGTAQLTNCFSSTYDSYRIVFGCTTAPAGGAIIYGSMLNGTTPNNTAATYKYYEAGNVFSSGAADNTWSGGTTTWFIIRSDSYFFGAIEIQNPYNSVYTTYQSEGVDAAESWESRGQQILNNSYDGIQFYHSGGNLNGLTIACYGYRKP